MTSIEGIGMDLLLVTETRIRATESHWAFVCHALVSEVEVEMLVSIKIAATDSVQQGSGGPFP